MKELVLYIHGKGGSAAECEHYKPLLPNCEVFGLDYRTFTPWETGMEIHAAAEKLKSEHKSIILIANSIGAFFSMNAEIEDLICKAYFISPIVDMEKLIINMMLWANVTLIKTSYLTFFLLRVVEMQRICEATATPDADIVSDGRCQQRSSMEKKTR